MGQRVPSLSDIGAYIRAADYLSAIQIYLRDNTLLKRPLEFKHIKPRLLGHWGTCPGLNVVYAHMNRAIIEHKLNALFIAGPGHGFPALQANLFLEESLRDVNKKATITKEGITYLAKQFSWPYGFPSHANPEAPGVIVEGGELGYSLSTAYGAVLDNPDLWVACVVGDGEAETGPTATAWHAHRIIDPATSGTVIPILHLNGYKISGPTLFGRMTDDALRSLFKGYGYEPLFVSEHTLHQDMSRALDRAVLVGNERRQRACAGQDIAKTPPVMIIMRTPKGMGGIATLRGKKIEGNHYAHQTVVKEAMSDLLELHALEDWLRSYSFNDLFDGYRFTDSVLRVIPERDLRMGSNPRVRGGSPSYVPLVLPDPLASAEPVDHPGVIGSSSMHRAGDYLAGVFRLNKGTKNFRMFSPDETYSNKLDAVFKETARAWAGPQESFDEDLQMDGRVHEMLSEHTLQGMMQGYVLTGRHAIFASYEAFIQIISSMVDQYAKFLRVALSVPWRKDIPSLNYILTSSGWRQEHNGFSHQNPGFIDDILLRQGCFVNVYFPADGNMTLAVLDRMMASKKEINILVAGKTLEPRWLSLEESQKQLKNGLATWEFASEEHPHVVVVGVGDYVTKEALAAVDLVKKHLPRVRMRFVNVTTLTAFSIGAAECHGSFLDFEEYFTKDKPIIVNFHGYPQTIKKILFDYGVSDSRCSVHGYVEQGSTTTPFDMHVRNGTSRYHLAKEIAGHAETQKAISTNELQRFLDMCDGVLAKHREHVCAHGVDLEEIENWTWHRTP